MSQRTGDGQEAKVEVYGPSRHRRADCRSWPPFFRPEARGSGIPQVKTAFYAVGLVGGLAAVAFNESLLRLRRWFRRSGVPACATPGLGGLMLGCIGLAALLFTQ